MHYFKDVYVEFNKCKMEYCSPNWTMINNCAQEIIHHEGSYCHDLEINGTHTAWGSKQGLFKVLLQHVAVTLTDREMCRWQEVGIQPHLHRAHNSCAVKGQLTEKIKAPLTLAKGRGQILIGWANYIKEAVLQIKAPSESLHDSDADMLTWMRTDSHLLLHTLRHSDIHTTINKWREISLPNPIWA